MRAFVSKYYYPLFLFLLGVLLVFSFLLGVEEGKRTQRTGVVFSCDEKILSNLSIPLGEFTQNTELVADERIPREPAVAGSVNDLTQQEGTYVGSKNGTKYYKPSCGMVKRIKPENYVWFTDAEDAQIQGYTEGSC